MGARLSLSEPAHACLFTRALFPPNKHYLFHYFPSLCGNSFLQSQWARALSLATGPHGLVARIHLFHCCGLTSISGWGTKILLQAAAGQGHQRSVQLHVFFPAENVNVSWLLPYLFRTVPQSWEAVSQAMVLNKIPQINLKPRHFPGGTVVKNPSANAGDTGSIPSLRRSQMPWSNLSPCATTTEPARHNYWSLRA